MKYCLTPRLVIGLLLPLIFQVHVIVIRAQCVILDRSRSSVFVTYDSAAKARVEDDNQVREAVRLRLHNNSTCDILITSGSAEKFYKTLPPRPSVDQILKREINHEMPDGVLVPEVQYRYTSPTGVHRNIGGDMFFVFTVRGKQTILFDVSLDHFGKTQENRIELPFQYVWEVENQAKHRYPSVENVVRFHTGDLPVEIRQKLR